MTALSGGMLTRLRVPLLIAVFAALLLLPATGSASLRGTPEAATNTGSAHQLARLPEQIVWTGDGSGYFSGALRNTPIAWTKWGRTAAIGAGADWLNDCQPDCAAGHFHAYRAKIKLDRPKRLGGHLVFTRLTITYTGRRPARLARKFSESLHYSHHLYVW